MIGDMYPFSTRRYILFLSTIYYWRSIALDLFYSQSKKLLCLFKKKKKNKKKRKEHAHAISIITFRFKFI